MHTTLSGNIPDQRYNIHSPTPLTFRPLHGTFLIDYTAGRIHSFCSIRIVIWQLYLRTVSAQSRIMTFQERGEFAMGNEPSIPLVLALDDAYATLEQVGGKGASLGRMVATGLPVPPGFHVTTAAYRRFVTENGLEQEVLAAVSAATADNPAMLEEASSQIER